MNANPFTKLRARSRSHRARIILAFALWIAACLLLVYSAQQPEAFVAALATGLVSVVLWVVNLVEMRRFEGPAGYVLWLMRGGYVDPTGVKTNKAEQTPGDRVRYYDASDELLQAGGDYVAPLREGFRTLRDSELRPMLSAIHRGNRWRWIVVGLLMAYLALAIALTPRGA